MSMEDSSSVSRLKESEDSKSKNVRGAYGKPNIMTPEDCKKMYEYGYIHLTESATTYLRDQVHPISEQLSNDGESDDSSDVEDDESLDPRRICRIQATPEKKNAMLLIYASNEMIVFEPHDFLVFHCPKKMDAFFSLGKLMIRIGGVNYGLTAKPKSEIRFIMCSENEVDMG